MTTTAEKIKDLGDRIELVNRFLLQQTNVLEKLKKELSELQKEFKPHDLAMGRTNRQGNERR